MDGGWEGGCRKLDLIKFPGGFDLLLTVPPRLECFLCFYTLFRHFLILHLFSFLLMLGSHWVSISTLLASLLHTFFDHYLSECVVMFFGHMFYVIEYLSSSLWKLSKTSKSISFTTFVHDLALADMFDFTYVFFQCKCLHSCSFM